MYGYDGGYGGGYGDDYGDDGGDYSGSESGGDDMGGGMGGGYAQSNPYGAQMQNGYGMGGMDMGYGNNGYYDQQQQAYAQQQAMAQQQAQQQQAMMNAYQQQMASAYGQPMASAYGQPMDASYGQPMAAAYGQPMAAYQQQQPQQAAVAQPASKPQAQRKTKTKAKATAKSSSNANFKKLGALGELLSMVETTMTFMDAQETDIMDFINSTDDPKQFKEAKDVAIKHEKAVMQPILDDLNQTTTFLNNIILVENLFNATFNQQERAKQRAARQRWAADLDAKYSNTPKPISDVPTFKDLIFAQSSKKMTLKRLIEKLDDECKANGVRMVSNSGVKGKDLPRAFYKCFYVYALEYGQGDAHKQVTDMLRCSLVFDDFDHLYHCFNILERLAMEDSDIGGIKRVKDRFHPDRMPFGYRDMLINVSLGESIVCEIQLHHQLFYSKKKVSHKIYKVARLFDKGDTNLAYIYADKKHRKQIGNKVYELKDQEVHESDLTITQTMAKYGLDQFVMKLKENGYITTPNDDISECMSDLPLFGGANAEEEKDLVDAGMKRGHIKKYKTMIHDLKQKEQAWAQYEANKAT